MIQHSKPKYIPQRPFDPKGKEPAPLRIPKHLSPLTLEKLLVYTSTWTDGNSTYGPKFRFDKNRLDFYEMKDDPFGMFPMYFHMEASLYNANYFIDTGKTPTKSRGNSFTTYDILHVIRAIDFANLKLGNDKYEEQLIGLGPQMAGVFDAIDRFAQSNVPILIIGETGTGKELVARAIWRKWAGNDSKKPFIPINCAAFPSELIESELFGHEKGAFTGAVRKKMGLFEEAGNGVVFLDEIGEIPPLMQVKLLRAMNERKFKRVGDNAEHEFHARIIAATNRPLNDPTERENESRNKSLFREDLYYRLAGALLRLPSLRERVLELPLLIYYHALRLSKTKPLDILPHYLLHFITTVPTIISVMTID